MLSIFQNRRWDGDFLTVRRLIDEGQLGNVRWVEMAWQRWGPACLDRVYGEFALAAYHSATRRTFLTRDPSGARPLIFANRGQTLAFASMPRTISESTGK